MKVIQRLKSLSIIVASTALIFPLACTKPVTNVENVTQSSETVEKVNQKSFDVSNQAKLKLTFVTQSQTVSPNNFLYPQCTYGVDTTVFKDLGIKLKFKTTSGRDAIKWWTLLDDSYRRGNNPEDNSIQVLGGTKEGHVRYIRKIINGIAEVVESNVPYGNGLRTLNIPVSKLGTEGNLYSIGYIYLKPKPVTYEYRIVSNKLSYSSLWNKDIIDADFKLNGSTLTVNVRKSDFPNVLFKNKTDVTLRVGSPQDYGTIHDCKVINPFGYSTTLSVNLAGKDFPESRKTYWVRISNSQGWAWKGGIVIERIAK